MWLENGNTKSGLIHIIEKHGSDLTNRGINDIPQAIKEITTNVAPYYIGDNGIGVYADYIYNGKRYRIAYGYNGYIISFYPIK